MTRPVTIEDVAQAAGVSVATVSRALRGLPNVAPSTREKVSAVVSYQRVVRDYSHTNAGRAAVERLKALGASLVAQDAGAGPAASDEQTAAVGVGARPGG